jgi:hypothetical protein
MTFEEIMQFLADHDLPGLIADETRMSRQDLQDRVKDAYWYMLSEVAVADVAAETP